MSTLLDRMLATLRGTYLALADAKKAGAVTINYGLFVNGVISFLIVAFAVFLLVRQVNRFSAPAPAAVAATKDCRFCGMSIPIKATQAAPRHM